MSTLAADAIASVRPTWLVRTIGLVRRFGRSPRGLVTGFVLLHVAYLVALAPIVFSGDAEGDVPLYRTWATSALHGSWPVLDFDWVYPAGALVPVVAPILLGRWAYQLLWLLMIAAANALAIWTLTGGLRRRSGYRAAWYWLLVELVLAPVSMLRLEGVAAPLAIAALVLIARRPALSGALIAAATWIKVWPAAIAAAAVTVCRGRVRIAIGGLAVTAAVCLTVIAAGGARHLFSFAGIQGDRALQLESPVATPWVWGAVMHLRGFSIFQDQALATREVTGPGAHIASDVVDVLMAAAAVLVLALLWRARRAARRDRIHPALAEQRLVLLGSFALAAALIVFNKVGSPQYMLWLTPIVAVGLTVDPARWRRPAWWMIGVCFATTLVFPVLYLPLVDANPIAAAVLLVRNLLVVAMFVWSVVALARVGSTPRLAARPRRMPAREPLAIEA